MKHLYQLEWMGFIRVVNNVSSLDTAINELKEARIDITKIRITILLTKDVETTDIPEKETTKQRA